MVWYGDMSGNSSSCQKLVIQLPGLMFEQRTFGNLSTEKCFQKRGLCVPCLIDKMSFLWCVF